MLRAREACRARPAFRRWLSQTVRSGEKQSAEGNAAESVRSISEPSLQVGDFVDSYRFGRAVQGVIEEPSQPLQKFRYQVKLRDGRTSVISERDVVFSIPGFLERYSLVPSFLGNHQNNNNNNNVAHADLLMACGDAADPVLALKKHQAATLRLMRVYKPQLDALYQEFHISRKQDELRLEEVRQFVFPEKKSYRDSDGDLEMLVEQYAILRYLLNNPLYFAPAKETNQAEGSLQTIKFFCRDQEEVQHYRTLTEQVLQNQEPVREFVERMRKLLRTHAPEFAAYRAPPVPVVDADRPFLQALMMFASCDRRFLTEQHPLHIITSAILKDFSLSPERLASETRNLLMRLGVWRPWQNVEMVADLFRDRDAWRIMRNQERLESSVNSYIRDSHLAGSGERSTQQMLDRSMDGCKSIRKNFGTLPAFAIDDYTVQEVDDAVSLEADPADAENPWIHVHVADPTAFMTPGCPIGQLARERALTMYFPDKTIPMIPYEFAKPVASLSENRANLTLTISFKLDHRGDISNYKVRPGIIHNLHHIAYEKVDQYFHKRKWDVDFGDELPMHALKSDPRFEKWIFPHRFVDDISPPSYHHLRRNLGPDMKKSILKYQETMHKLLQIAQRHYSFRMKEKGAVALSLPKAEIFLRSDSSDEVRLPHEIPEVYDPYSLKPAIFIGIDNPEASIARKMVAEFMIMAGRALGMYAQAQNVPVIFRTQKPAQWSPEAMRLLKTVDQKRVIPPHVALRIVSEISPTQLTTDFGQGHFMLGVDNYAQVTSPLRRISDVYAHWQVKSVLAGKPLAFTKDDLNQLFAEVRIRERAIRRLQNSSNDHWTEQFLIHEMNKSKRDRYWEPRKMNAFVVRRVSAGTVLFLKEIATRFLLRHAQQKPDSDHQPGQWIQVVVERLDNYGNLQLFEA